jgi:hypothetical protein
MDGAGTVRTAGDGHGEWRFLLCLIAGFLVTRLIWLAQTHGTLDGFLDAAEATRAALSVARHGVVGDAYFIGQGPSAHLMPLNPMIAGGIMWLLGPGSTAANYTLLAFSLGQVIAGYLLVRLIFIRLGADPVAVRWGTALLMLLAPFVPQEVVDFRYWEGASALCLVALNLLAMIALDRRKRLSRAMLAGVPPAFALACFVSPPAGLALAPGWAIVALRSLRFGQAAALAVATALAVALLFVPWTMRNATVLGATIPTRSNLGIELALAMHPAAVSGEDQARVFHERVKVVTPSANREAQAFVRQHGETAFSNRLAAQSWRWMRAHPADVARLWARHVGELFVPRPWMMYFSGWEGARAARAATIAIVQLLGLAGLTLALIARRRGYGLVAGYVAMMALSFGFFQPMPRYGFLIYAFFAFLAAEAVSATVRTARDRRAGASPAVPAPPYPGSVPRTG